MVQLKNVNSAFVRQFSAGTSAALLQMSSGCWNGWPSASIPQLITKRGSQLVMAHEEISWMVSMVDIGILVTPLPTGYLMDRLGRKKIIISAGVLFLISWLLTAVAYNAWFLYTARFLAGLAIGISLTVLPIYLGEIASVSMRGALSTMVNLFMWTGVAFELMVGPFVSFQVLVYLSVIPSILLLLTFPFMPESPYFLAMKDRHKDAFEALTWLRGTSTNTLEQDMAEVKEWVDRDRKNKVHLCDLVSNSGIRRGLLIILGLVVFQKFIGSLCIVAYSSTTLPLTGWSFGPSETMIVFACVNVFSNLLLSSLVDRLGRRSLLLFSAAGTALLRGFSALYYFFERETNVDTNSFIWVPYVCVVLAGVTQPGIGSIPFTLQGELFPTFVKSHAGALSTITNAVTAFLVDKLYVTVDKNLGVYVNYLFFCVCGVLCIIFVLVFVFETKGMSFIAIQIMLERRMSRSA